MKAGGSGPLKSRRMRTILAYVYTWYIPGLVFFYLDSGALPFFIEGAPVARLLLSLPQVSFLCLLLDVIFALRPLTPHHLWPGAAATTSPIHQNHFFLLLFLSLSFYRFPSSLDPFTSPSIILQWILWDSFFLSFMAYVLCFSNSHIT